MDDRAIECFYDEIIDALNLELYPITKEMKKKVLDIIEEIYYEGWS